MPSSHILPNHPTVLPNKTGVLLVNLGTPDGHTYWPMRRYLKEFLSDRRVIEAPRWLWWVILNVIILSTRPQKAGKAYAKIWNREQDESPLRTITRNSAQKMQVKLPNHMIADWAFRYGQPNVAKAMDNLLAQGARQLVVLPLYPQYAAATTGTVCDVLFDHLKTKRTIPPVQVLKPYYDHPAYIQALVASYRAHIKNLGWQPEALVVSFHGLPLAYCQKGDVYACHCHKTHRLFTDALVRENLIKPEQAHITFQSRFGPQQWLTPATDDTLEKLAHKGLQKVAVICPGFAADCVETLEEINLEAREEFMEAGGIHFTLVPCLNDSAEAINLYAQLVCEG